MKTAEQSYGSVFEDVPAAEITRLNAITDYSTGGVVKTNEVVV